MRLGNTFEQGVSGSWICQRSVSKRLEEDSVNGEAAWEAGAVVTERQMNTWEMYVGTDEVGIAVRRRRDRNQHFGLQSCRY